MKYEWKFEVVALGFWESYNTPKYQRRVVERIYELEKLGWEIVSFVDCSLLAKRDTTL